MKLNMIIVSQVSNRSFLPPIQFVIFIHMAQGAQRSLLLGISWFFHGKRGQIIEDLLIVRQRAAEIFPLHKAVGFTYLFCGFFISSNDSDCPMKVGDA